MSFLRRQNQCSCADLFCLSLDWHNIYISHHFLLNLSSRVPHLWPSDFYDYGPLADLSLDLKAHARTYQHLQQWQTKNKEGPFSRTWAALEAAARKVKARASRYPSTRAPSPSQATSISITCKYAVEAWGRCMANYGRSQKYLFFACSLAPALTFDAAHTYCSSFQDSGFLLRRQHLLPLQHLLSLRSLAIRVGTLRRGTVKERTVRVVFHSARRRSVRLRHSRKASNKCHHKLDIRDKAKYQIATTHSSRLSRDKTLAGNTAVQTQIWRSSVVFTRALWFRHHATPIKRSWSQDRDRRVSSTSINSMDNHRQLKSPHHRLKN